MRRRWEAKARVASSEELCLHAVGLCKCPAVSTRLPCHVRLRRRTFVFTFDRAALASAVAGLCSLPAMAAFSCKSGAGRRFIDRRRTRRMVSLMGRPSFGSSSPQLASFLLSSSSYRGLVAGSIVSSLLTLFNFSLMLNHFPLLINRHCFLREGYFYPASISKWIYAAPLN